MKKNRGYSLLEVIITLGIVLSITVAMAAIQRNMFSLGKISQENLDNQKEARRAFDRITKDVRNASYASNGSYPISAASTSSLTFFSDIDGDGYKEQIRYYLDSNKKLKRGIVRANTSTEPISYSGAEASSILINKISNTSTAIFNYYTANYNGTTSSSPLTYPINIMDIRLLKIDILLTTHDSRQQSLSTVMTTNIMFRNLKDNL